MNNKKGLAMTIERRQAIWAYIFILVPLIFFLWIRIYPVLSALNISLHKWDILSSEMPFVGLENFQRLGSDEVFRQALFNTFKYVIISSPVALLIALCVALMLNRINKCVGFFRMLYFVPYVTSVVAVSWTWRWMFNKQSGVINNVLRALGIGMQPFLDSTSQAIYVIISNIVWHSLGYYTIIFLAGLKQIPSVYYEAAEIDGAGPAQKFFKITIPLLNPTIVYLSVMSVIQNLQSFTQVYNITSSGSGLPGGPLNSTVNLVVYIYQTAFKNHNMGYASAMTVVLLLIIMSITLLQLKVLTKRVEY